MNKTIEAGQTYFLRGTLAAGGSLVGDTGDTVNPAGALVLVGIHTAASNDGTLSLQAGPSQHGLYGATGATLAITGTLTNDGLIALAGGAAAPHGGGSISGAQLQDRGTLRNAGTIQIGGVTQAALQKSLDGTGAILRVNGSLANTGTVMLDGSEAAGRATSGSLIVGGVLTNSGTIWVDGGNGTASRGGLLRIDAAGTLVNSGDLVLLSSLNSYNNSTDVPLAAATLQVGGLLDNQGTIELYPGVIDDGLSQGAVLDITSTGQLTNSGLLKFFGGGFAPHFNEYGAGTAATVTNDGVLTNLGTLVIGQADVSRTPTYAATLSDVGVLTNSGLLEVQRGYGGYYGMQPGGVLAISGVLNNTGTVYVGSGSGNSGGLLTASGTINNTGVIIVAGEGGGLMNLSGVLTNQGYIQVQSGLIGNFSGGTLNVSGTLINDGTITLGFYEGNTAHSDTTNFFSHYFATLAVTGLLDNAGTVKEGMLTNTGTVIGGVIDVLDIGNGGTLVAPAGGSLLLGAPVLFYGFSQGTLAIDQQATLTCGSGVYYGQNVDFVGTSATLALTYPGSFFATIEGLRPQTTIDFLKTGVISAKATGTTLALGLATGGTLDFRLAAPLPANEMLVLQSDQHGGTDLTVTQSSNSLARASGSYGLASHERSAAQLSLVGALTAHLPS
jgi:hypothetical protein